MAFEINVDSYSYASNPKKESGNYAAELAKKLVAEESAVRIAADKALKEQTETSLEEEATERKSEILTLSEKISTESVLRQTKDKDIEAAIAAETSERHLSYQELNRSISELAISIADEIRSRTAADDEKADRASTLAGYGITNAYTKEETDERIFPGNIKNGSTKGSLRSVNSAPEDDTYEMGENAVTLGKNTKSFSPASMASGINTKAGMLGYYWSGIDFEKSTITLTRKQGYTETESFETGYEAGDIVSIINNAKYPDCSKIISVDGNVIEVDALPFSRVEEMEPSDMNMDDYSVFVISKSHIGAVPLGYYAHAEGDNTAALERASHAEGRDTKAYGQYSHAEGRGTTAYYRAHAEGGSTVAEGDSAHAEGRNSQAIGGASHAEGKDTIAKGFVSHAEGHGSQAMADNSHAEGHGTQATGDNAHAQGYQTTASGGNSHAEGHGAKATGLHSHAEGLFNEASGYSAHAQGRSTLASGPYAHAEGQGTIAAGDSQHVQGLYNIEDTKNKYLHIVGNGSSDKRANAHTLDRSGNAWFKGNIRTGGTSYDDGADIVCIMTADSLASLKAMTNVTVGSLGKVNSELYVYLGQWYKFNLTKQ